MRNKLFQAVVTQTTGYLLVAYDQLNVWFVLFIRFVDNKKKYNISPGLIL